mgnify:CR=1 FL=1
MRRFARIVLFLGLMLLARRLLLEMHNRSCSKAPPWPPYSVGETDQVAARGVAAAWNQASLRPPPCPASLPRFPRHSVVTRGTS